MYAHIDRVEIHNNNTCYLLLFNEAIIGIFFCNGADNADVDMVPSGWASKDRPRKPVKHRSIVNIQWTMGARLPQAMQGNHKVTFVPFYTRCTAYLLYASYMPQIMPAVAKHLCEEIVKIEQVSGVYTLIKVNSDATDSGNGNRVEPGEPRDVAKRAGLRLESPVFKGRLSLGPLKALYMLKESVL